METTPPAKTRKGRSLESAVQSERKVCDHGAGKGRFTRRDLIGGDSTSFKMTERVKHQG